MFEEQRLVRVDDDDVVYSDAKLTEWEGYVYTLPEKRRIGRILIYHKKVKNMDVYVGREKDDWRLLKQIVGDGQSPVIINTFVFTDRIRIVIRSVGTVAFVPKYPVGGYVIGGYVQGVELYQFEKR